MFLILFFTLISFAVGVELLPSDEELCLGSIANWTCTVNGNAIGWVYNVSTSNFYTTNATNVISLGSSPFRTGPTSISGGVATSMATANLSSNALNGTTLECTDGTNSSSVSFNLIDSSAATSVDVRFDRIHARINLTWSGATCVTFYRVYVNNDLEDTVSGTIGGTSFSYIPQSPDIYSFQISSVNYFGRDAGYISIPYPWLAPTTMINVEFVDGIGFRVSFQDNNIGQPPVTECNIILNDESTPCQLNETYTFPIRDGVNYTYNVTVRNVVGSISETGDVLDLMRPTEETVKPVIGDPVVFAIPFVALGVLIVLFVCWIVLRICWKRQCCCPRIWRSDFWLIFFCYDCCTYDAEVKEGDAIGLKNPNVGGEKGATSL